MGCDNGDNDDDDVYDDGLSKDAQNTEQPVMNLPARHKVGTKIMLKLRDQSAHYNIMLKPLRAVGTVQEILHLGTG